MRVALVNLSLRPGRGSDRVMRDLAAALADTHDLEIYSLRDKSEAPPAIPLHQPSSRFGAFQLLIDIWRRRDEFDVINCHHAVVSLFLPNKRLVTTHHGYRGRLDYRLGRKLGPLVSRWIRRLVVGPALRRSRLVTVVSKMMLPELAAAGVPGTVIYNGVAPLPLPRTPSTGDYMLYVGRIALDKQVDELLAAFSDTDVDCHLHLSGEGADLARLQSQFSDPRIRFLGRLTDDELSDQIAGAIAFVTGSRNETFCLPVIEAAQLGCPTVGPASGALPEVVDDGVTGFLASPGRLGEAIKRMVNLPTVERDEMSQSCRAWAEKFSMGHSVDGYEAVYRKVMRVPAE